jgi:ribonuclease-3
VNNFFLKSIRLFFHPKKESYFALKRILGFFPNDISLYEEALLHKSSFGETIRGNNRNNERLEFLGDAILNAVVADIVFKKFKNQNEGFLTTTRSKIVKRETLDIISCKLGLNNLVIASLRVNSQKNHILGNALEAFIGAVYLDQGYSKTYHFIERKIIAAYMNIDALAKKEVNFKSKLLEWSQKHRVQLEYQLLENTMDRDFNPVFQSQAILNGLIAGIGTGYSKKESHQQAAETALKKINSEKKFVKEVMEQN